MRTNIYALNPLILYRQAQNLSSQFGVFVPHNFSRLYENRHLQKQVPVISKDDVNRLEFSHEVFTAFHIV